MLIQCRKNLSQKIRWKFCSMTTVWHLVQVKWVFGKCKGAFCWGLCWRMPLLDVSKPCLTSIVTSWVQLRLFVFFLGSVYPDLAKMVNVRFLYVFHCGHPQIWLNLACGFNVFICSFLVDLSAFQFSPLCASRLGFRLRKEMHLTHRRTISHNSVFEDGSFHVCECNVHSNYVLCVYKCIYVCLCISVFACICNRRPTVCLSKLFQLLSRSSVSVNQDWTSRPVLSHDYALLAPPYGTRAQHTCSFMCWLSCQCWTYGPTYIVKYSVALHHLNLAVGFLSRLYFNCTGGNPTFHYHFLCNVCYSFVNTFWRPCHTLCYSLYYCYCCEN